MEFTGERFLPNLSDEYKELAIEHYHRYFTVQKLVKDKIVLDIASGEGYGSYLLSKHAKQVYGVDIDAESIAHAQSHYHRENLEFIRASVDAIPMDNHSVDIVVSYETIEHVNEDIQKIFLAEVNRVLKPGGIFVVSTPDKSIYTDHASYRNEHHIKEFYKEEFRGFLEGYFKRVILMDQRFEVNSVISDLSSERFDRYHLNEETIESNGKYIVAVCTDSESAELNNMGSIITYPRKYAQTIDRILDLQNEVDIKNDHIHKILEQLSDRDFSMNNLLIQNEQLLEQAHANEIARKQLQMTIDTLQDASTTLSVDNKRLACVVEEVTSEIEEIHRSHGWIILSKYYRMRDFILPEDSRRRLFAKLFTRFLKNPGAIMKRVNKENVKKFFYYLKVENMDRLDNRIDNYIDRYDEHKQTGVVLYEQAIHKDKIIIPTFNSPRVSIIIPVYNQWDFTYNCVKSIVETTVDIEYEIIIADDVSSDETMNIHSYIENIKVARSETNKGFLRNCNQAAEQAQGEYIVLLNNDTQVQENWLSSLVELLDKDSSIGMTGSKLIYPDGRLQEAGGIIWSDASGWNYGRLDDPEKPEYNYVREVDYISAASIMIRSDIWRTIGGFDERYIPAYYEDVDLAFEVRKAGFKVVYQPKSVVVHFEGISHGTNTTGGVKLYQVANQEKFLEKWRVVLQRDQFENAKHVFQARDRSRFKNTILVIDHYVPHFDKDAGGRCTTQYLKLFIDLGFRVIFIGDNFFKHEPYSTNLEQIGIEILYGEWSAKNIEKWIKDNGQYLDFVYLIRPHISIKYIDSIKKHTKAKVFYFAIDLHYVRELRNYEIQGNEELLRSSERWKKIEFELFEKADIIHVVGSYEKQILDKLLPDKIVRNIPLYLYESESLPIRPSNYSESENILFVGGFGHAPNYDGVKWFIQHIFPQIKSEIPDVKFLIAGSNPPRELDNFVSDDIHLYGYVSEEKLAELYYMSRVVVAPLRFGAGVKGKVVEAIAHQIPLVTTSIGAEGLVDIESVVRVATTEEQFARSVIELYNNEEIWNTFRAESSRYIMGHFSKETAKKLILLDANPGG